MAPRVALWMAIAKRADMYPVRLASEMACCGTPAALAKAD